MQPQDCLNGNLKSEFYSRVAIGFLDGIVFGFSGKYFLCVSLSPVIFVLYPPKRALFLTQSFAYCFISFCV
jgi:hypothetical protein